MAMLKYIKCEFTTGSQLFKCIRNNLMCMGIDGLADISESMHNSIFWMRRRINVKSHIVFHSLSLTLSLSHSLSLSHYLTVILFVCLLVCIGNRTKTKANDHGHQRLYSAFTKRINNQFTRNVDNPNHIHTWPIIIYLVYLEHTYITFVGRAACKRAPLTYRPDISIQCTQKRVLD